MKVFHKICVLVVIYFSLVCGESAGIPINSDGIVLIPQNGEMINVKARCGKVAGTIKLQFGEVKKGSVALNVKCLDMVKLNHHYAMTEVPEGFKDAALRLTLSGTHGWKKKTIDKVYFIRPDLHFYYGEDFEKACKKWAEYLPASQHFFDLSVVRKENRMELWIDGRYFTGFPVGTWKTFNVSAVNGAEVKAVSRTKDVETARYLPLNIPVNPHRGKMKIAEMSVKSGMEDIAGIPMNVVSPDKNIDVGCARWLGSDRADPYYKRSSWDGIPETIIFSIPKRFYNRLQVLCAVDHSEGRGPAMGVRLARYRQKWNGPGATQADINVTIDPDEPQGCTSIKKVGTIQAIVGNKKRTLPLYLVEIPLKTGELSDYLQMEGMDWDETSDYFYLEFTRPLKIRRTINSGTYGKKPLGNRSGIHIFGATLEKAPVKIFVGSDEIGNIFYKNEDPSLKIEINNPSDTNYRLSMSSQFTDFFGNVQESKKKLVIKPGKTEVPFDLKEVESGWYSAEFSFTDKNKRVIWKQPLTLALLPPDTRQAGDESPYGIWWFRGAHYSEPDADRALPLVQKMGFRHVCPWRISDPKYGVTSENFARYKVTVSMMRRLLPKRKKIRPPIEEQAREFMKKWPGTPYAMIFHETRLGLGIGLPEELLGETPPQLKGELLERRNQLYEEIVRHEEVIHKVAPDAKIILGNGLTLFNVFWLREGLPRKYWDAIGMEMAVQRFSPEGQPTGWNLQSLWIAKKMREIYGYEDLPITSCFEFDYRATAPGALSLDRQANWYARDILHCLAYRMPNISVGLLDDCNSTYYFSRWGSTGVCFRSPLMMPKPAFVALSTLTRILDMAEYQRYLDTGSHSLYCLEFKKEGDSVYTFWTTRGKYEVTLTFKHKSGEYKFVDIMGREKKRFFKNGKSVITASESPGYVITRSSLDSVKAGTPSHENLELTGPHILDNLANSNKWEIVKNGDKDFQNYCAYKPLRKGKFSIANGEGTLKISLISQLELPDIAGRYMILEPEKSISIPGKPNTIGIWVKGNSNWGRIIFEVIDAKGRRWTSNGWEDAPNSWDMSDWEDETSINFDGWKFISTAFPLHYPSGYYESDFCNWRCQGDNSETNKMVYPLKFNRLYIIMREKLVYVTDMVPANSMTIKLKDLTVGTKSK